MNLSLLIAVCFCVVFAAVLNGGSLVTILSIQKCSPDPFSLSFHYNHPNIIRTYGITNVHSRSVLAIEKLETSLTNLLRTFGNELTVRERTDLAIGIVSAVEYLHHSHCIPHGRLSTDTVFFTSLLRAKVLDPDAALMVSSGVPSTSMCDDVMQLQEILTSLFSVNDAAGDCFCRQIVCQVRRVVGLSSSNAMYALLEYLNGIRGTQEYLACPAKRSVCCPLYQSS